QGDHLRRDRRARASHRRARATSDGGDPRPSRAGEGCPPGALLPARDGPLLREVGLLGRPVRSPPDEAAEKRLIADIQAPDLDTLPRTIDTSTGRVRLWRQRALGRLLSAARETTPT